MADKQKAEAETVETVEARPLARARARMFPDQGSDGISIEGIQVEFQAVTVGLRLHRFCSDPVGVSSRWFCTDAAKSCNVTLAVSLPLFADLCTFCLALFR